MCLFPAVLQMLTSCDPGEPAATELPIPLEKMEALPGREDSDAALITADQRKKFELLGKEFAAAVRAKDLERASSYWEFSKFSERMADPLTDPEKWLTIKELAIVSAAEFPLLGILAEELFQGSFEFLRLWGSEGKPRLLFSSRMVGRVRYLECIPLEMGDHARIIDIYHYHGDVLMSDSIHLGQADNDRDFFLQYHEMRRLDRNGEDQATFKFIQAQPDSIRLRFPFLYQACQSAHNLAFTPELEIEPLWHGRLQNAVAELEHNFPGHPALPFYLHSFHAVMGNQSAALEEVSKMESWVGGDPYLDALRSSLCRTCGDFGEAIRYARQAVFNCPDEEMGYWELMHSATGAGDHLLAYETLNRIVARFGLPASNLIDNPDFARFFHSDPGERWIKNHGFREPSF